MRLYCLHNDPEGGFLNVGVYQLGTAVTITETFTVAGSPTNPTNVTITVQDPSGTDTSYVWGIDAELTNPSTGVFVLQLSPPGIPGKYIYTVVGTGAVEATGTGDFTILDDPTNPTTVTWAVGGPCTPWCDANDVWVNCGRPMVTIGEGTSATEVCVDMTPYAQMASWLLFTLSGRLYAGRCERTVRPCSDTPCGFQMIEGSNYIIWPTYDGLPPFGYGWDGWRWNWGNYAGCGCTPLDRIRLAGYPVREVLEVKIDGVVVPETNNWRLDERRFLTRVADASGNAQTWPSCQRLDLPDTAVGTFSVSYAYGQDPPLLGQAAAAKLACELYNNAVGGECALPSGTTRVIRQGITIDKLATIGWYRTRDRGWVTGIAIVDAFLNGANPYGLTRRPVMMAPGNRRGRFAQSVGS